MRSSYCYHHYYTRALDLHLHRVRARVVVTGFELVVVSRGKRTGALDVESSLGTRVTIASVWFLPFAGVAVVSLLVVVPAVAFACCLPLVSTGVAVALLLLLLLVVVGPEVVASTESPRLESSL
jgi:hypothetical protein